MVVAICIVVAPIIVFFAKRALARRDKQETERRKSLSKYARLQQAALLTAYRNLYEEVDMRELSEKEFLKLICAADDLIMKPFTDYRNDVPADLAAKIYNDIHNDLAQFKLDPGNPRVPKREAICALFSHRERFLQKIESVGHQLRRYQ